MNSDVRIDLGGGRGAELLSALHDGEASSTDAARACALWQEGDAARQAWHRYQLIGDVMRSDELSSTPAHDEAFLAAVRKRLADEPVVLAPPVAVRAAAAPARHWMPAAAIAAGFAAVAVSVIVLRPGSPQIDTVDAQFAERAAPSSDMRRVGVSAAPAASQALIIDGTLIRDARLDAYFDAHRGAFGGLSSAVPGGAMRSVDTIVPQR